MSTWHVTFLLEAMLKLWALLCSRALLQAFAEKLFRLGQVPLRFEQTGQVVDAAQCSRVIVTKLGTASASGNEWTPHRMVYSIGKEKWKKSNGWNLFSLEFIGTVQKTNHVVASRHFHWKMAFKTCEKSNSRKRHRPRKSKTCSNISKYKTYTDNGKGTQNPEISPV